MRTRRSAFTASTHSAIRDRRGNHSWGINNNKYPILSRMERSGDCLDTGPGPSGCQRDIRGGGARCLNHNGGLCGT